MSGRKAKIVKSIVRKNQKNRFYEKWQRRSHDKSDDKNISH
jgi:hypothetical protein